MPYARTYRTTRAGRKARYSRTSAAGRTASVAKARAGGNKAVARTQKKRYVPKVVKNTASIFTLARQVKALQKSQIGQYQKNYEHAAIGSTINTHTWAQTQPFLFALNDFTPGSPIYVGSEDLTTYPGTGIPGYVIDGHWSKFTPVFAQLGSSSYWKGANDDEASRHSYLPLGTSVTFNLQCPNLSVHDFYWVRIDVIRMKKDLLNSNAHQLSLPKNVQALGKMAADDLTHRNKFNSTYFQVIQTKWIKMTNNTDAAKSVHRYCKINYRFKDKVLKLDMEGDIHTATGEVTPNFVSNMPQDEIIWCLLSTSQNNTASANKGKIQCQMTREISYRDSEGVAT